MFLVITLRDSAKSQLFYVDPFKILLSNAAIEIMKNSEDTRNYCSGFSLIDMPNDTKSSDVKGQMINNSFMRKFPIRVEFIDQVGPLQGRKRKCSFLLIKNIVDFEKLHVKLINDWFRIDGFFMIVMTERKIDETQRIAEILWNLQIYNSILIYQDEVSVKIETTLPFDENHCENVEPKTINEYFANETFKNSNFYIDKIKNMHKCPIKLAMPRTLTNEYTDVEINIVNVIAEKINFTAVVDVSEDFGYILENGSSAGEWKKLMDSQIDIVMSFYYLVPHRTKFFGATIPYFFENILFVVPKGRSVSGVEKLIKPFNLVVWVFLIGSYVIGLIVIRIVNVFGSMRIKNFVYGTRVLHPHLNMFSTFMGLSHTRLPNRNFSRFLLMNFIIFSLNIRTIYMGMFFKNIHLTLHHGHYRKLSDVSEKNLTFTLGNWLYNMLDNQTTVTRNLFKNRFLLNSTEQLSQVMIDQSRMEEEQYVAVIPNSNYDYDNHNYMRNQFKSDVKLDPPPFLNVLEEVLQIFPVVIYTTKNHYLINSLNNWIELLRSAGLIRKWYYEKIIPKSKTNIDRRKSKPKSIDLKNFEGIFKIWISGLLISLLVFLVELTVPLKFLILP